MLTAFAVLLCFTALLAYLNERFLHFPTTVGVTLAGALSSILLIVLDTQGVVPGVRSWAAGLLNTLNFTNFVLNGILSLLLFAGSLSLDAGQMLRQRGSILLLAFFSTVISTFLIGVAAYGVFQLLGLTVPPVWALLFGALISPTDPVAVLDLLGRARVPARIKILIAGESLFNDGVGVVIFLVIAAVAGIGPHGTSMDVNAMTVLTLFAREALGGVLFGAALGYGGFLMLRSIAQPAVEVLITLALVLGGYVAAAALGMSGPLAMVVAGLVLSATKHLAFDGATRQHVETFWETIDQVLNIILFSFIGLDVLLTRPSMAQVVASVILIGVALAARYISVALPFTLVRAREGYGAYTVRLLTWGGLRGGIAISLALGLPDSPYRPPLLTATYAIVLFTIAVQGLTIMPLVHRAVAASGTESSEQRAGGAPL
ncbi:sodium:proton antiporter [Deinococcus sp. KSM4-11]|uniref:cation:proton antiporter n=1 Tax=Deinococcus sp. KSM4-11 TaxID=2568654 RepID=UPI0010A51DAB|nr:sodium:proton antiporter [Deinococcus sp. KSM4-11]THF87746.1 sodium:proton antiporter [Deinococcus sp. KSM4-11]